MPNYWLLIERIENWRIDQTEGFRGFGIPERKRKVAEKIKKDDLLIFYVSSGISALADVRKATEDGVFTLRYGGGYDVAYPFCIRTRPYLTLERSDWVSFKALVPRLSLTKDKSDWRQMMRNSILPVNPEDAELMIDRMRSASRQKSHA